MSEEPRHILALSGGKDSTALALFMRKMKPELQMEYAFADTGRELPEVYQFLDELELVLEKPIAKLTDYGRTFDYYLERWNYYLPGQASRWCTKHLKIRPFERFVGSKKGRRFVRNAVVYIGIRSDEAGRTGNYGIEGVRYSYPFVEYGVDKEMVMHILADAEIELPGFYKWRSTGGCWMCPWQRRSDWLGLKRHHPELFDQAMREEERATASSPFSNVTWSVSKTRLVDLDAQQEFGLDEDELGEVDQRPCLICAK